MNRELIETKVNTYTATLHDISTEIADYQSKIESARVVAAKTQLPDFTSDRAANIAERNAAIAMLFESIRTWLALPDQIADMPLLNATAARCGSNGSAHEVVSDTSQRGVDLLVMSMLTRESLRQLDRERWLGNGCQSDIERAAIEHTARLGIGDEHRTRVIECDQLSSWLNAAEFQIRRQRQAVIGKVAA